MNSIYVPSNGPDDWQRFLAKPDLHWKTGRSARTLAHAWENASGLPIEIAKLLDAPAALLIAIPEHKVPLPGGSTESQSDLFAIVRSGDRTSTLAIEGKVDEAFGPTIGEWFVSPSPGKQVRMKYLCDRLGFTASPDSSIRYQLLHRTASALIEADRFKTDEAAMFVHSFSRERAWFDDFRKFVSLFGAVAVPDRACVVRLPEGRVLRLGWATGDARYLDV